MSNKPFLTFSSFFAKTKIRDQAPAFSFPRNPQHKHRSRRDIWMKPIALSHSAPDLSNVPVLPWTFRTSYTDQAVLFPLTPAHWHWPVWQWHRDIPGGERMALHAPRQNGVGQAATWLLEKQQELIMGRAVHGIKLDVGAMGHPSLTSNKTGHVPSLHSSLSFVIFLAYSVTSSVTYPPFSFSCMAFSGKSQLKTQVKSSHLSMSLPEVFSKPPDLISLHFKAIHTESYCHCPIWYSACPGCPGWPAWHFLGWVSEIRQNKQRITLCRSGAELLQLTSSYHRLEHSFSATGKRPVAAQLALDSRLQFSC